MKNELEFLEELFREKEVLGDELQFFKYPIFDTKLKIYQRILELRELRKGKKE